ncbi:MAG: ParB/RepB/Spo0J family partition protein [Lachnospiraceae bacterium]|nr:ParB/RepB/Spo0J family partition protein [Lachnospiraceae bacterium]MCR4867382.1 ParB/RepB/Spo0J family partition protein [Lachnospiraceae bacterium]
MAAKKGLGKGLDTLIPSNVLDSADNKQKTGKAQTPDSVVDINKVEPNRDQPRKNFDEDALEELADSIRQVGLIQPIVVQDRKGYYEIIAGERRWRACKKAGLKEIPVIIRNFTEQEIVEISIIENIQREDLNPIEEAMAYKRLLEEFNLKQDEVAEKVSKNRTTITNSLRLLKLTDDVQQMIVDGKLSTGHARAIISIEDPAKQLEIAEKIFDEKMSVREVEKYIKSLDKPAKPKKKVNESLQVVYDNIEEQLKLMLGTKVSILSKSTEGSGKLEIEFYNHDDLERIVEIIKR